MSSLRCHVTLLINDKNLNTFLAFVQTFQLLIFQDCVQGSTGEGALAGMPLQLAGSRKILEFMDRVIMVLWEHLTRLVQ